MSGLPLCPTCWHPEMAVRPGELERLLRRADRTGGPDSCWLWKGPVTPGGYGNTAIWRDRRRIGTKAHRAVYQALHGDLPRDIFVLHSCDNPPCCNPLHLRAGTHLENMADRREHGAGYGRGADAPTALQVPPEVVEQIRDLYSPRAYGRGQVALAKRFGISRTTVQRIVTRSGRWVRE